jgi:hypothetical protein
MLTGVIEVQDRFGQRKVLGSEMLEPVARIAQRQLLLRLIPADLRRLTPQLQPQFVQLIKTR